MRFSSVEDSLFQRIFCCCFVSFTVIIILLVFFSTKKNLKIGFCLFFFIKQLLFCFVDIICVLEKKERVIRTRLMIRILLRIGDLATNYEQK